ncbi:hypothetical protein BEWA_027290 [Theileria equi strain WA]|uniref:Uncharacterized protein n=1 Tax=Theileria equi strain WA TaxID=1537102 RepID=L0AWH3_THEEQ|nr:hypothetical protein BEWA_027290 [Theileria equi strain WA]AFZ79880.1 hypothetical protein BEWA_027290 [Theileria equi strain WA]|eukprot:XP_004829546.1 hypothetical protein BEWA_027290 [Theileria equi strain WA]
MPRGKRMKQESAKSLRGSKLKPEVGPCLEDAIHSLPVNTKFKILQRKGTRGPYRKGKVKGEKEDEAALAEIKKKCGSTKTCTCGTKRPKGVTAKREDLIHDVKGFVTLAHYSNRIPFRLSNKLDNNERLDEGAPVLYGVTRVSVYYWVGDKVYDKPLLLEVDIDSSTKKKYYYKDEGTRTDPTIWKLKNADDIKLQVMLDDRNYHNNSAVPFEITDPTNLSQFYPSNKESNSLKNERKIMESNPPPNPPPGNSEQPTVQLSEQLDRVLCYYHSNVTLNVSYNNSDDLSKKPANNNRGWYKKGISDDALWTWIPGIHSSIKEADLQKGLDCKKWQKLRRYLKDLGCHPLGECPENSTKLTDEHLKQELEEEEKIAIKQRQQVQAQEQLQQQPSQPQPPPPPPPPSIPGSSESSTGDPVEPCGAVGKVVGPAVAGSVAAGLYGSAIATKVGLHAADKLILLAKDILDQEKPTPSTVTDQVPDTESETKILLQGTPIAQMADGDGRGETDDGAEATAVIIPVGVSKEQIDPGPLASCAQESKDVNKGPILETSVAGVEDPLSEENHVQNAAYNTPQGDVKGSTADTITIVEESQDITFTFDSSLEYPADLHGTDFVIDGHNPHPLFYGGEYVYYEGARGQIPGTNSQPASVVTTKAPKPIAPRHPSGEPSASEELPPAKEHIVATIPAVTPAKGPTDSPEETTVLSTSDSARESTPTTKEALLTPEVAQREDKLSAPQESQADATPTITTASQTPEGSLPKEGEMGRSTGIELAAGLGSWTIFGASSDDILKDIRRELIAGNYSSLTSAVLKSAMNKLNSGLHCNPHVDFCYDNTYDNVNSLKYMSQFVSGISVDIDEDSLDLSEDTCNMIFSHFPKCLGTSFRFQVGELAYIKWHGELCLVVINYSSQKLVACSDLEFEDEEESDASDTSFAASSDGKDELHVEPSRGPRFGRLMWLSDFNEEYFLDPDSHKMYSRANEFKPIKTSIPGMLYKLCITGNGNLKWYIDMIIHKHSSGIKYGHCMVVGSDVRIGRNCKNQKLHYVYKGNLTSLSL